MQYTIINLCRVRRNMMTFRHYFTIGIVRRTSVFVTPISNVISKLLCPRLSELEIGQQNRARYYNSL